MEKTMTGPYPTPTFDAAAIPPRFLFLQVNKRCNLRCLHCAFWTETDDDRARYLDRDGKRRVIAEFATMNPGGAVVICGGESMLDLDDYFDIPRACRERGLTCISVVNGTRIRSAEMAERMILEGPHEISISLNSHRADLHDETRGVPGAFDKAVAALRLLLEARRRVGDGTTRIYVMGLIFDQNCNELEDFYDFVLNDVGADKLKLNFLQPSFGDTPVDTFFAEHHAVDPDALIETIRRCDARFRLNLNPAWMEAVRMYFGSLRGANDLELGWGSSRQTRDHICNTYERNVMVDHYGMARLCFSTDFRAGKLAEDGDLGRFWQGAEDIRAEMRGCNKFCGISHSVRRISSTLSPAAYSRLPETAP
jgi:MoaA/NifB/PqqE/SkfB family radical SAM enzyme